MKTETFGETASVLKPLAELHLPDPRWKIISGDTESIHERVSSCVLQSACPDLVRRQFEIARNLALYSWFVFEFSTVAELQAYLALEHALRTRMPEHYYRPRPRIAGVPSPKVKTLPLVFLGELLKKARDRGFVRPSDLPYYQEIAATRHNQYVRAGRIKIPTSDEWFDQIVLAIPDMRNPLAHGQPHLVPGFAFKVLALTADIINQLFPEPA